MESAAVSVSFKVRLWTCRTLTQLFGGRLKAKLPRRWGGYFREDADHRDFVAIGTAAGNILIYMLELPADPHSFTQQVGFPPSARGFYSIRNMLRRLRVLGALKYVLSYCETDSWKDITTSLVLNLWLLCGCVLTSSIQ